MATVDVGDMYSAYNTVTNYNTIIGHNKFHSVPSLITNQRSLYTYGILRTKSHLVTFLAGRNQYFPKPNNLYNLETNVVSNTEATITNKH
jgi:hypothetical protein